MCDPNTARQQLEDYHLLWRENENRLNHLALLKKLALRDAPPDPRLWSDPTEEDTSLTDSQTASRGCPGFCTGGTILRNVGQGTGEPDPAEPLVGAERQSRAKAEYTAYQKKIAPILAQNRHQMQALEQTVNKITEPLCREILRLRYFDCGFVHLTPWRLVALRLYGNDDPAAMQYIRRLHARALEIFASLTA